MWEYVAAFMLGFLFRSLFSKIAAASDYLKAMQDLEIKFLLLVSNYIQWREQALTALKLSYKFMEYENEEDKELKQKFLQKVEEKYDEIINGYVNELVKILPYTVSYTNLDEIKKFIDKHRRA
jgi:hypothetical protein